MVLPEGLVFGLFSAAENGAGSNMLCRWTFSPLSLLLCLLPEKQQISSNYIKD